MTKVVSELRNDAIGKNGTPRWLAAPVNQIDESE
jgi:hypothetical protein